VFSKVKILLPLQNFALISVVMFGQ